MNKIVRQSLLTLFLVSCTQEVQSLPLPMPVSLTPSPVPSITTSTLLVSPAITNTPYLASTKTFTPTSNPIYLTEAAVVLSCASKEREWYSKHLSATYYVNDDWGAFVCSDNGIYTKVTNESLDMSWEIPAVYENLNPPWYWEPFLWSPDGRYLYMESKCLCSIDSPWLIYTSGFGLSRLDLYSGQVSVWLTPSESSGYTFSFSNDLKLLAFPSPDYYRRITIRDLISGEDRNIGFKEKYTILEYRWTPDNSRLVIFTEEYANNPLENGFSVFVYSIKNDALIKLVDKNNLNFTFPTEYHIEPSMTISDLTNDTLELLDIYDQNKFQINIRSGDIATLFETSTPIP